MSKKRVQPQQGRGATIPRWLLPAVATLVVAAIVVGGAVVMNLAAKSPSGSGPTAQPSAATPQPGAWTNVSADQLAAMLQHKDFTLLNVKTPYIGEIAGTDLYIPYDQLSARRSELPAARDAKMVVYCRSGAESALAVQTLLGMGYTNIYNLDGGMNAWTASGRSLVNLNRTGS